MVDEYKVNEQKMLEVVNKGKREVYDLTKPLKENSLIVQNEKRDILHQMDLASVITNLDNAVDLLDVSYHAVYGFPVQSRVFSLQKRVMDLNDQGIIVVTDFKNQSSAVVAELIAVFKWLINGAESVAIGKLEKFADIASGMSEQANDMADAYQAAADSTSSVLQSVMEENAKKYEESDNLRKMLADFQSEQDSAAQIQESISGRLKTLKAEYERLSRAEEREEKHRSRMEIVGMVFSFLGKAVSVAGNVAASQMGTPNLAGSNTQDDAKIQESRKKKEDLDNRIAAVIANIAELEKEMQEKIAQKDSADRAQKDALEKEITDYRNKIRTEKENLEKLKAEQKSVVNVLQQLGDFLSDTGSKYQQTGDEASLRSSRMKEIYDEMIRLEEENTKQLGLLAKYAKQVESVVIDQNATEAAIQSLIIAVSCLKRTVVALKDIAMFWNSLEVSCRALADSSLKETIKDLQSIDKAERVSYYYSEDIMYPLLCYMAKWTAIFSVSTDYIKAAEKTREHLNDTIINSESANLSRADHWNQASSLAGHVSARIEEQVAESQSKVKNIADKKNAL